MRQFGRGGGLIKGMVGKPCNGCKHLFDVQSITGKEDIHEVESFDTRAYVHEGTVSFSILGVCVHRGFTTEIDFISKDGLKLSLVTNG